MKRICLISIFLGLFFPQYSVPCFASLPKTSSITQVVSRTDKNEPADRLVLYDIGEISEEYSYTPHLCREIWGGKHSKHCMDQNRKGLLLADSRGMVNDAMDSNSNAEMPEESSEDEDDFFDDFIEEEEVQETIADPLEPINRVFFLEASLSNI